MDPETAQMIADLSNRRRDLLAAPEERHSRRNQTAFSEQDKARFVAEETARRAELFSRPAANEREGYKNAWNNPAFFGRDEIAEQMEDRYGGQGHRAAMTAKIYGEERHTYVPPRAEILPSPPFSPKIENRPSPPAPVEPVRTSSALRDMAALTAAKATGGGVLNVDYYGSDGKHHANRLFEVVMPVSVTVNVYSKGQEYDPLAMAAEMEALAKHLMGSF